MFKSVQRIIVTLGLCGLSLAAMAQDKVVYHIDNAAAQVRIALTPGATHAYLRPEIRDAAGKILMIGNAIYVGPR